MSWTVIAFQAVVELVSPSQLRLQLPPAVNKAPGAGSTGVTSAAIKKTGRATTIAVRKILGNIARLSMCKRGEKRIFSRTNSH